MKTKLLHSISVAVLLAVGVPVFAHHGNSRYEFSKTITLNGTVTAFEWANPHCLVYLDVNNNGTAQHWTIELASTFNMSRRGWTKDLLKQGDQVTVETHPAKNGVTLGISSVGDAVMKFVDNGKVLPQ